MVLCFEGMQGQRDPMVSHVALWESALALAARGKANLRLILIFL